MYDIMYNVVQNIFINILPPICIGASAMVLLFVWYVLKKEGEPDGIN